MWRWGGDSCSHRGKAMCLLKAPPKRVTGFDTIMPYYRNEDYFMIHEQDIVLAARELVEGWK